MTGKFITFLSLFWLAQVAWAQNPPAQDQANSSSSPGRYANMPTQAVPFHNFRKPYQEWYVDNSTMDYRGAARLEPDGNLSQLKTVNIGFLGPLDASNPESPYGIAMLHGVQMAIDQANASGGYQGKPFALKVHDDLPLWGASSMEIVKMDYDDRVWAMLGSIDAASTHIELRATLKLEIPIMDTGTTDPTVTETGIQWLMHDFPDDRQQGYALADYIFNQLKLKNVGVLRVNDRYGRKGYEQFFNMARRSGHQPMLELKYLRSDKDFSDPLEMLKRMHIDGLVIWGEAPQAGLILKQMRAMGMHQPVFGSSRVAYPEVVKIAGTAAEGLVTVTPLDPTRQSPDWLAFRQKYVDRFHTEPDAYATQAYDGIMILTAAIRKAGLNRARIMDALRAYRMKQYDGVGGPVLFDYTLNDISPLTFAQVKQGKFVYWPERRTDLSAKAGSAGH